MRMHPERVRDQVLHRLVKIAGAERTFNHPAGKNRSARSQYLQISDYMELMLPIPLIEWYLKVLAHRHKMSA